MTIPAVARLEPPQHSGPTLNGTAKLVDPTPKLSDGALAGLAGDFVRAIAPHTEAPSAALLLNFHVGFGCLAGNRVHALVGSAEHPPRIFGLVVGASSRTRKGTAWTETRRILREADDTWDLRQIGGLSSGEGVIKRVAGGQDVRLMVVEEEFARVLKASARDGSILSEVIRVMYDGKPLHVMKLEALHAPDHHICMVGMITQEELMSCMTGIQIANGFANRMVFVYATRSKTLPRGGNLDDEVVKDLGQRVAERIAKARDRGKVRRSPEADELWDQLYLTLDADEPSGVVGALTARNQPHVLRLSLIYMLEDEDNPRYIEAKHINAAMAFWQYSRDSIEFIFGDRIGDPHADRIRTILEDVGEMTRTDLSRALGGRVPPTVIDRAVGLIESRGWLQVVEAPRRNGRRSVTYLWVGQ